MRKSILGEANINFIGRMGAFAAVSAVLVTASVVAVAVLGLNYGIDFAGGYEIQVKFPQAVEDTKIRELVQPVAGDALVQRFGQEGEHEFLILVRKHGSIDNEKKAQLLGAFEQLAGGEEAITTWSLAESGESLKVGFAKPVPEAEVRQTLENFGLTVKGISRGDREDEPVYQVSLRSLADEIDTALKTGLNISADAPDITQRVEFVGPQVGAQLRNQGIMAVLAAMFFILLYIGVRFDLSFAPGAVIALLHDVLITVGVFAVTRLEFNLTVIAAVLAVVGYSLNDTIVIYDRIRENVVRMRGRALRDMVNGSLNQTLSRTLLTSLTTLLVVVALLFFGGGTIRPFASALLVGVFVGTYSSLGIATSTYVLLRERFGQAEVGARGAGSGSGGAGASTSKSAPKSAAS